MAFRPFRGRQSTVPVLICRRPRNAPFPVEEAVDRLYGLPLEDFVAERDAIAGRRRTDS